MQRSCGEEEEASGPGGETQGRHYGDPSSLDFSCHAKDSCGRVQSREGRDLAPGPEGPRAGCVQAERAAGRPASRRAMAALCRPGQEAGGDSEGRDGRGSACSLSHRELEAS